MDIPRRANRCEIGGEPFERGSSYVSQILETERGFERKDYCQKCGASLERRKGDSIWNGKIPEKNEKAPMDEKSFQLLEELLKKNEEREVLTLLVLSLCRKKQLIKIDATHYESAYTGTVYSFKPATLDPKHAESLLGKLKALLDGSR